MSRKGYNERLFENKGPRSFVHKSRFNWVKACIKKYNINTEKVIELGCFDGRILNYLPELPKAYKGYDANWEKGLDLAREKSYPKGIEFHFSRKIEDIKIDSDEKFDLAISLETLEHLPPEDICDYLKLISNHLDGYFLITIPVEKGLGWLIKKILRNEETLQYNFWESINVILERTNYIERNDHKGFDYDHMIYDIRKFFEIVEIGGLPFTRFFPKRLSWMITIIAKKKLT